MGRAAGQRLRGLRDIYEHELAAYLTAQDVQLQSARKLRWPILIIGLSLSGGAFAYLVTRPGEHEILLMADGAFALATVLLFAVMTGSIADDVRHKLLASICGYFGFTYEPKPDKFPCDDFAILDLGGCNYIRLADRVTGQVDGLAFDLAAGKIGDEWTEMSRRTTSSNDQARLHIRFDGLLMRFADPAAPKLPFRLVPRAGRIAPDASTGDAAFDAVFAIEADDLPQARHALDAPTRAALTGIAAMVGGTVPSIGFAEGAVLLAFPTQRRFEIGKLKPPLADFARVEHLAQQVAVVFDIAAALRTRVKTG